MNAVRALIYICGLAMLAGAHYATTAAANSESIIVQSTTSTDNSGLYDHILPQFKSATGIRVHVVAVGTGQAIKNAQNCDGDVLLVHAKEAEETFVASGFGVERHDLMYNDFVIVGRPDDPAKIAGLTDASAALARIAEAREFFASRGDNSGTHKKEMALWNSAGVDPAPTSGDWYRETGSGMGATINVAVGLGAYVLTDRATWISYANKRDHRVLVEGDSNLFNQYGVILVNKERCPDAKSDMGQKFIDWLLSPIGQAAIAAYAVNKKQLFFPNAKR